MGRRGTSVIARIGLDDKGFQQGVQKIQRSLRVVKSEFAAASSKLGDFGKTTEGLRLKSDNLNKQMELQKAKVSALTKSYQESVETKGSDAKATENLQIKLNYAIRDMNKMEKELKDVNGELKVQSSRWTVLGTKLQNAGDKMQKVGKGFSSVGKKLTTRVTAPIVAAGAGLVKLSDEFKKAENTIRVGTGATGESLEGLKKDFKSVYTTVNASMEDTSNAIADLNTRTGLAGKPLQNLTSQMLKLSKITGEDINRLIPATTRMFKDAGIGADEYSEALDYTFKVSQSTGIGVGKLQELMTKFGGPLRQMGFDWKTTAAMLGKFEKEGVNTELVLGSMRIALGKMAREGIAEPNKALKEMIRRIKETGSAGEANAMALEMFGSRAGPDMAAAIREGRLEIDTLIDSIKDSPETIEKAAKDTESFSDKFAVLKNKMAVAFEPLGKELVGAIEGAIPAIEKLIINITKIIEKFTKMEPAQQKTILKIIAITAAIGPLMSIIGKIILIGGKLASIVGSISTAIGGAGGMSGVFGAALTFLTGPIGIIIGAIGALIGAFLLLYKKNRAFREKVKKTWSEIKEIIGSVIEGIKNIFIVFIDKGKVLWEKFGGDIVKILSGVFSLIGSIVKTALNIISGLVKIFSGILKGDWKAVFEGISIITRGVFNGIKGVVKSTFDILKGIVGLGLNIIKNTISKAWNEVKSVTTIIWDGIKNAAVKPILKVRDTIKGVVKAIKGFFSNLRLPGIKFPKIKLPHFKVEGGFSINPPRIPKFGVNWYAKGGIFNKPSVIGVGEAGQEAVIPIDRLDDIIANALNKVKGGKEGSGVTLNIERFINNSDKDIEQLAYELEFYRQRINSGRRGES